MSRSPWFHELLEALPDDAQVLEQRLAELAPAPRTPECERDVQAIRAAHRHATALRRLARPPIPAAVRDGRCLDAACAAAAEEVAARLRRTPLGDALALGFTPSMPPSDPDWAEAVLETVAGRLPHAALATPARAPGWLVARVRADRAAAARRQGRLRRLGVLAAAALISAGLWFTGLGPQLVRPSPSDITIEFVRSRTPLDPESAALAIVQASNLPGASDGPR